MDSIPENLAELVQLRIAEGKQERIAQRKKLIEARSLARIQSLLRKTDKDGCWEWQGSRDKAGYGLVSRPGHKVIRAHRYFYEQAHGPIPDGMVIRHKCDNPPCCNPAHLCKGTLKDNARDRVKRGRTMSATDRMKQEIFKEAKLLLAGGITEKRVCQIYNISHRKLVEILSMEYDHLYEGTIWAHSNF